jgi:hypothetical protein
LVLFNFEKFVGEVIFLGDAAVIEHILVLVTHYCEICSTLPEI